MRYDLYGTYKRAVEEAQEQTGHEVYDEVKQAIIRACRPDIAKLASEHVWLVSVNFDDFETEEIIWVSVVMDATDAFPTEAQGAAIQDEIENAFGKGCVYTNEPYDEDGKPQHLIEFMVDSTSDERKLLQ